MNRRIHRRQFHRAALALAAGIPCAVRVARSEPQGDAFAFLALGDVHFDRLEHHDLDWLRRDHPNDVHQVEQCSRITGAVLPKLLNALRAEAQSHAEGAAPVRFVAQLGDLIEGMCGRPELADRQCEEAVAYLRAASLGAPFVAVKGNHEIQGPGARAAYDRHLLPFAAEQARLDPKPASSSFTIREGNALFAFFDAYDEQALSWLETTLAKRGDARHVFVLLHPPVVPFGARSLWHLYARPAQQTQRERLLNLLGRHRAIVLSAHLHRYGAVVRRTESGRFLQLALSSVLPSGQVHPKNVVEGVGQYGPDLVTLEPRFSPSTEAERRAALRAEAPYIEYYEHADAPGYARIEVRGDRVTAAIHDGIAPTPRKVLDLSAILESQTPNG